MKTRTSRPTLQAPLTPVAEPPLSPARAFVVHFREDPGAAGTWFTGRAEHMITGASARFESPQELLAFFARVLGTLPAKSSEQA